jgi:hypothetical protein
VSDGPRRPSGPPAATKGPVEQLHLLTGPAALDLDQVPGPDGFAARVYASSGQTSATVVLSQGTLEILMFDGLLKDTNAAAATPLRVWTFPAGQLRKYEQRTSVGVAYVLTLLWGESRPTQSRVTVAARYLPAKGPPLSSGASTISVALK